MYGKIVNRCSEAVDCVRGRDGCACGCEAAVGCEGFQRIGVGGHVVLPLTNFSSGGVRRRRGRRRRKRRRRGVYESKAFIDLYSPVLNTNRVGRGSKHGRHRDKQRPRKQRHVMSCLSLSPFIQIKAGPGGSIQEDEQIVGTSDAR